MSGTVEALRTGCVVSEKNRSFKPDIALKAAWPSLYKMMKPSQRMVVIIKADNQPEGLSGRYYSLINSLNAHSSEMSIITISYLKKYNAQKNNSPKISELLPSQVFCRSS